MYSNAHPLVGPQEEEEETWWWMRSPSASSSVYPFGLYTDGLAGTVQNGTGKNKFHIPFIFSSLSFNLFFLFGDGGWWWPLNKRWETEMCCVCVVLSGCCAPVLTEWRREKEKDGNGWTADDGWPTGVCHRRWCARHARKTRGFFLFQKLSGKK
jgi:hypothetical protein